MGVICSTSSLKDLTFQFASSASRVGAQRQRGNVVDTLPRISFERFVTDEEGDGHPRDVRCAAVRDVLWSQVQSCVHCLKETDDVHSALQERDGV